MNDAKRKVVLLLFLCLAAGFALRFYRFDQKSLNMDEVYTFQDSRDGFKAQLRFYENDPTYLHPPLFFLISHLFYPSEKPERDLRIVPVLLGTLSILLLFFLAGEFSKKIALPCAFSLTFMLYHISLSQDARMYAFVMFFGMASLLTLVRYQKTGNRIYLFITAVLFAVLFLTSYSSILFIVSSQMLWFYTPHRKKRKEELSSFLLLSGTTFLLVLPWLVFIGLHYYGGTFMKDIQVDPLGSFWRIPIGIFQDWTGSAPFFFLSVLFLICFPFFARDRRKAFVFLSMFIIPMVGVYVFSKGMKLPHFVASRYFVGFLPLFLIAIYASLEEIEIKFAREKGWFRPSLLFVLLFAVSNMIAYPLYYRSEKMDFRGLGSYLKNHLQPGDKIYVVTSALMPGILHYLGAQPETRHHHASPILESGQTVGYEIPFVYRKKEFSLIYSERCCGQWISEGGRLWIVVFQWKAKEMVGKVPAVLKGYFDGSFLNHSRFPVDASMYLFLWDPKSPDEKGIDLPLE